MLTGLNQNQIEQWKSSLYEYEKNKRTKKPFGKDQSVYDIKIVHSSEIKEKEREFDPLLQKFKKQSLEKRAQKIEEYKQNLKLANYLKNVKSNNDYDIVNLHPLNDSQVNPEKQYDQWSKHKNRNNPIRNLYNIINNQSIPSSYLKHRDVKVQERESSKKIYNQKLKQSDYNFIQGKYLQNNELKMEKQRLQQHQKIKQKINKDHHFDNVFQRYYNPALQTAYQSELYKSQLVHGINYLQKLPPSYRDREPLTFNSLDLKNSPALKKIIQKQQNTLRKNQLRYAIEQQYKKRNQEEFQKKQRILKNKVHDGKILQVMTKEYDIINNKLHQLDKYQYYQKNIKGHPYSYDFLKNANTFQNPVIYKNSVSKNDFNNNWETHSQARSASSNSSFDSKRFSIKSGGFS